MVCEFSLSFSLHSKLHWRPSQNSQLLFWQLWYFFNWHTLSSTRLGGILFCVCEVTIKSQKTQCLKILKNVSLYYIRKNYFLARKFNFLKNYGKFIISSHLIFWQENSNETFLGFFKTLCCKSLTAISCPVCV